MPVMQEPSVQSLGWKVLPEKEWQSTLLAWEIPWTEKPGRLQSLGSQSVKHD